MAELSEYEKCRAEQIRKNNAYLVSLGIVDEVTTKRTDDEKAN